MTVFTNDAALVNAMQQHSVGKTFCQRRDWDGFRSSSTPFSRRFANDAYVVILCSCSPLRLHFTNSVMAAESVSIAQRSRCTVPFLILPFTSNAALATGDAAAHCREDVLPTTRLW
jgi:hypothetical protein